MEDSLRGKLLIASPALLDPNFARTVVFITEHNDEGAMGIVLNRPSETSVELGGLASWRRSRAASPIYVGGPVQPEALVLLAEFTNPEAAAWIVVADVGLASADVDLDELADCGAARAGLRGLFGLGRGPARGRDGGRLVDRRAAAAGRAVPGGPGERCGATSWRERAASTR